MSENINTGETTELGENYNPPTMAELGQRMDELEERGVLVEMECHDCGATFDQPVLPEETDECNVSICRSCTTDHLRSAGLL